VPKLSDIRRIIPEDVDSKASPTKIVETVAGSYNEFADELYQVVNGQLDFENLARRMITLEITFDPTGKPTNNSSIASGLSYVSMIHIGKAQNLSNSAVKFTQTPYIDWTLQGNGIVKINYGIGFQSGSKYRLVLELIQ
jgi:hypothetical protein